MPVRLGRHGGALVVLFDEGTVGGVDARGGAPGTRELDVLAPENLVGRVDAVCVASGGPAGLAAADGVLRWLRERDRGFRVGEGPGQVVPIVPAATNPGGPAPDAEAGHLACRAAGEWAVDGVAALVEGAVVVVVVDAELDKARCRRVAISARDGLVRAGAPDVATTVFAAATGTRPPAGPLELDALCGAAADSVTVAYQVLRAEAADR
ncbi:putative hydrolase [Actinokineospora spheciospongiae]|uniref:Putative hydrolase n=1 Tax=Actinokineospora spheciospongiae TaxID=909613 RepID=W7IPZ8_9PSEU|nr:P1 family peptidase [Actinokineospora spheciospongiae]EWC58591.1 putative hydrolase [Actinokineospora spheciospongiae]